MKKTKGRNQQRVVRIPRPYGLTQSLQGLSTLDPASSQAKQEKDKIINKVIEQYTADGFQLNKQPANIHMLSTYLNIDVTDCIKRLNKGMAKVATFLDGETGLGLTRVLTQKAIFSALEIGALTEQQVRILLASQSGSYKPFISAEVNRSITNLIASHNLKINTLGKLFEALKGFGPGLPGTQSISLIGPTHAQSRTQSEQILDTEKAIKLLEERGQITALTAEDKGTFLGMDKMGPLPEVRANHQDLRAIGIKHNGLTNIPENEKGTHHEERREKELSIISEEDLDEDPID